MRTLARRCAPAQCVLPRPSEPTLYCPDLYCMGLQVLERVHEITKIELHYIADARGPTVTCKHGDIECAGNKQQLCVQEKSPGWC